MFGGIPKPFFEEYHKHMPKTEPVGQYEPRGELYELFHYLNHTILFGVSDAILVIGAGCPSQRSRGRTGRICKQRSTEDGAIATCARVIYFVVYVMSKGGVCMQMSIKGFFTRMMIWA
jgi:hypothetical protein